MLWFITVLFDCGLKHYVNAPGSRVSPSALCLCLTSLKGFSMGYWIASFLFQLVICFALMIKNVSPDTCWALQFTVSNVICASVPMCMRAGIQWNVFSPRTIILDAFIEYLH